MEVQLSFWRLPFLHLDGSRQRPTKSRFFRRRREYLATSNFGKPAVLHLQAGPLDPVPYLRIDGQIFRVCRKLRVWEQIWIALPLALMMFGGLLGGLLGASAVYTNALLLRRIRPWLPRFVVTGVVSLVSLQGYNAAASIINPAFAALQLSLNYQDTISPERDLLTSRAWVAAGRFDSAGNAITVDPRYDTGSRVYFMGNGRFTILSNQGLRADGRWSLDLATQQLSLIDPTATLDVVLQHIDPGYLVLRAPLFEARYASEVIVPTDQDFTPDP